MNEPAVQLFVPWFRTLSNTKEESISY